MNRTTVSATLILLTLFTPVIRAQDAPAPRPQFEVASVKPNTSSDTAIRFDVQRGGRFVAVNMPLKLLIRAAYTVQLYQIANAASWTESERFDVSAVADQDIVPAGPWMPGRFATVQLMLQSLLAERFRMVIHRETRQAPIYSLVLDKPEQGSSGRLTRVSDCASTREMSIGQGTLRARCLPLPQFAEWLSQLTGRVVIDGTGRSNDVDVDLRWGNDVQDTGTDAPSIFTGRPCRPDRASPSSWPFAAYRGPATFRHRQTP